ncbi:hypothetical protein BST98_20795 (plasmid) [Photobacterium damselae]|nr:hypothetical protein BST98_20795 [Photobacterium damselae]
MKMNKMKVLPAKGVQVRKPDGTLLAQDGETVERCAFWLRRIMDGDVAIIKQSKKDK